MEMQWRLARVVKPNQKCFAAVQYSFSAENRHFPFGIRGMRFVNGRYA
jgi:hypothetical protein